MPDQPDAKPPAAPKRRDQDTDGHADALPKHLSRPNSVSWGVVSALLAYVAFWMANGRTLENLGLVPLLLIALAAASALLSALGFLRFEGSFGFARTVALPLLLGSAITVLLTTPAMIGLLTGEQGISEGAAAVFLSSAYVAIHAIRNVSLP